MSDARNVKTVLQCDSCQSSVDSMGHMLRCPNYVQLRGDKDLACDADLAKLYTYYNVYILGRISMNIYKRIVNIVYRLHFPKIYS